MADTLTAYKPTLRDQIANMLLGLGGDHPPDWLRHEVGGLVGSTGLGNRPGGGLADFTPIGTVFSGDEAIKSAKEGDYKGAALSTASALAGMAGPAAKAFKFLKGAKGELAAVPELEYDPPWYPQRQFSQDYPNGSFDTDSAGRLVKSIDGDELTAPLIAGRRKAGQPDIGLDTGELGSVVEATTGRLPDSVDRGLLQGAHGHTIFDTRTQSPLRVEIADDLHPNDVSRVLGHETGHVIDLVAGEIPTEGLEHEVPLVYHQLATGNRYGDPLFGPIDAGYDAAIAPREYMADAIRAYSLDPNYLKTVAPKTAQRIRQTVNTHPALKDIIQFNSMALPVAGGGYLATQQPQMQNQNAKDAILRAMLGGGDL